MSTHFVSSDTIRTLFSQAMSDMYKQEVPLYQDLLDMVADVNQAVLKENPELASDMKKNHEIERLNLERHGAIRVGTAQELSTLRRLFNIMGMYPVGYYDLSVAGVPVHSTAFRPIKESALNANPFRIFTSLLRHELIQDNDLKSKVQAILSQRSIFTTRCLELIVTAESQGGLTAQQAQTFVQEALSTFRWHQEATVDASLYQALRQAHPLIADIVCFKGPHINHLTPRTLDIDRIQDEMPKRGIPAKAVIEGPAPSSAPILLRQTSFLALSEAIIFPSSRGNTQSGTHTARFGEIEQRGVALTPKGRQLYDEILDKVRAEITPAGDGSNKDAYMKVLNKHFSAFPDCHKTLREQGLAYYKFSLNTNATQQTLKSASLKIEDIHQLVEQGVVIATPITYEDFLPVSAAGIFRSNLGDENQDAYQVESAQSQFEKALGASVYNELTLYAETQNNSLEAVLTELRQRAA